MRLLATLLLGAAIGSVQSPDPLPARNQALLLLRVLAYDRNLKNRAGSELTVVVLFRKGEEESEREQEAMVSALREAASSFVVSGLQVRVRKVAWRDASELVERLRAERAAALYVGEALTEEASAIGAVARACSILSFAPSREMVEAGLALGLVNRGGRAGVFVNLAAARAEGADLDSAFLAVVEVAGKPPAAPR